MKAVSSLEWKTLGRKEIFSDPPWVRLSVEKVRVTNGNVIENFYQVALPEYAVMIPFTHDGKVVTELQYRHGIRARTMMFPSGYIEPGEDALSAAKRELLEETGFTAPEWSFLGSFIVDSNRCCGKAHFFTAKGARKEREPSLDETEDIEVILLAPEEVQNALEEGKILSMASALAAAFVQCRVRS